MLICGSTIRGVLEMKKTQEEGSTQITMAMLVAMATEHDINSP